MHRLVPFLICWALVGLVATWAPARAPAAPEDGVTVQVAPLDGRAVVGRLVSLDGENATLATAAGNRTFALDGIRRLVRVGAAAPGSPPHDHLRVILTGGEVLHGTYAGSTSDGFTLQTSDLGRVEILLDVVASVVAVPADADICFEPEHRRPALADDVAYTRSGDQVTGIVLAVDDDGFEIETAVRSRVRRVGWDRLLVLHLKNDPAPPPGQLRVEVETVGGSRLEASGEVGAEEGALVFALRSAPATRVRVPWTAIRAVRPSGGAFVYASSLPYQSELVWAYADVDGDLERLYGARANRRPSGCPLRLGGRTYRHGFAVHSRSALTIRTARAWKRFETLFGVDDRALERLDGGILDARVVGDGKVLWEAKNVRAGEAPRRVGPLDVSEVESLVLEVDFGAEMHRRDYATWADPLLIR